MYSGGRPTVLNTRTIVTSPAAGIPAAPALATTEQYHLALLEQRQVPSQKLADEQRRHRFLAPSPTT